MVSNIFVLFISVAAAISSRNYYNYYKDYKLYNVFPVQATQENFLRTLALRSDVEFWDFISLNRTIKVIVAPSYDRIFKAELRKINLEFKRLFVNIQNLINKQKASSKKREFLWTAYKSLEQIDGWLENLLKKYPDVVSIVTIGKSHDGRDLKGIIINNNKKRENNTIIGIIEGTIHGREWMSAAVVTWIINEFLTSTDREIRRLASDVEWHIFPVINPDGYAYSFEERRFWQKNRHGKYLRSCKDYGGDDDLSHGVDLNRNFDIGWLASDSASNEPCSHNFGGGEPLSEQETLFLTEYVEWKVEHANLLYYLSFHEYLPVILIPYGHTMDGQTLESPNYEVMYKAAKNGAERVKRKFGVEYKVGLAPDVLYPTSSSSIDHMKYTTGVPRAYQIGVGEYQDYGYLTPPRKIVNACRIVMELLVEMDGFGGSSEANAGKGRYRNPKKYEYLDPENMKRI